MSLLKPMVLAVTYDTPLADEKIDGLDDSADLSASRGPRYHLLRFQRASSPRAFEPRRQQTRHLYSASVHCSLAFESRRAFSSSPFGVSSRENDEFKAGIYEFLSLELDRIRVS